jgi:hypothetical protein
MLCHNRHCSATAPFNDNYLSPTGHVSAPHPYFFLTAQSLQYCAIIAGINLSVTLFHLRIFTVLPPTSLLPSHQPTAPVYMALLLIAVPYQLTLHHCFLANPMWPLLLSPPVSPQPLLSLLPCARYILANAACLSRCRFHAPQFDPCAGW